MHPRPHRHTDLMPTSRRALLIGAAALASAECADASTVVQASAPVTIGWSTIYLKPAWTTQTAELLAAEIDRLRTSGRTIDYTVFDAEGDTARQESHLRTMIERELDICLLIAGSATDLNDVVADAHWGGMVVVSFDSLVSNDQVTATVFEDQVEMGPYDGALACERAGWERASSHGQWAEGYRVQRAARRGCPHRELQAFGIFIIVEPGVIDTEFETVMAVPLPARSGTTVHPPLARVVVAVSKGTSGLP